MKKDGKTPTKLKYVLFDLTTLETYKEELETNK